MKVYNLCCEHEHRFEGWFSSEEDFVSQSAQSKIACPVCNNRNIKRLPSAPRLNLSTGNQSSQDPQGKGDPGNQLQAQWLNVARQIIASTEDVGKQFAEEVRRMHYKEVPDRSIRGVATPDERTALAEEGIDVMPLPLPEALKHTLQ